MTVTTTNNQVAYTGDGVTVNFPVTMPFFVAPDLIVYMTDTNGNTAKQVLNTNYTVTGGSTGSGAATGTVIMNVAPPSAYKLLIVRNAPFTQQNTYINNDIDDAGVRETADDRLTILAQQALAAANRAIAQPAADINTISALPTSAQRAGKYLAFDLNGNPIATQEVGAWRGAWGVGVSYNLGDVIEDGAAGTNKMDIYVCQIANTSSSSFTNDVAAGDWAKVIDVVLLGVNAGVSAVNSLSATSTTSLTVGTGSQSLTVQASKSFNTGSPVFIVDSAATANWMAGQVTSYNSTTGALVVNVTATGGSGTIATWNVYVSGYTPVITPTPVTHAAISGLIPTAISGTNTTAAVTISAGQAADSTNAAYLSISGNTSWAVSNGNAINGYAGGTTLPNSSTIHFFICNGTSGTGTFASTSLTPTFPTGYTTYSRRIFSLKTNSSGALLNVSPNEIAGGAVEFLHSSPVTDVSSTGAFPTTTTAETLTVPGGIKVNAIGTIGAGAASLVYVTLSSPDTTVTAGQSTMTVGASANVNSVSFNMRTNTSSQLNVIASGAGSSPTLLIITLGWIDGRRS